MSNLHPIFDDILQSYVSVPTPRVTPITFDVTVIQNGETRNIVTRAVNVSDAVLNVAERLKDGPVTIIAKPR